MPVIRLRLSEDWCASVQALAAQRGIQVNELILETLAFVCPQPSKKPKWFDNEAAAQHAANLCSILQSVYNDITTALKRLEPPPNRLRNQALVAARRKLGHSLKSALAAKGMRQADVARAMGVGRQMISSIICGRTSLPSAWLDDLNRLLGEGWMND